MKLNKSKSLLILASIFALAIIFMLSPVKNFIQTGNAAPPAVADGIIELLTDGTNAPIPFELSTNDSSALTDPGEDQSDTNQLVRAGDTSVFKTTVNLNGVDSDNVIATVVLTNGKFTAIPSQCLSNLSQGINPPISLAMSSTLSANDTVLFCNLGIVQEGTVTTFNSIVRADSVQNNTDLIATLYVQIGTDPSTLKNSVTVKITSAPKVDIVNYLPATKNGAVVSYDPSLKSDNCLVGGNVYSYDKNDLTQYDPGSTLAGFPDGTSQCNVPSVGNGVAGDLILDRIKVVHTTGSEKLVSPFNMSLDQTYTYVSGQSGNNNSVLVGCEVEPGYETSSGTILCASTAGGLLEKKHVLTLTNLNDSFIGTDGIIGNYRLTYFIPHSDYPTGTVLNSDFFTTGRATAGSPVGNTGWDPTSVSGASNYNSSTEFGITCPVDPGPGGTNGVYVPANDTSRLCNNRISVDLVFPGSGWCAFLGVTLHAGCSSTFKPTIEKYVSAGGVYGLNTGFAVSAGRSIRFDGAKVNICVKASKDNLGNYLYYLNGTFGSMNLEYQTTLNTTSNYSAVLDTVISQTGGLTDAVGHGFRLRANGEMVYVNPSEISMNNSLDDLVIQFSADPLTDMGTVGPLDDDRLNTCDDNEGTWETWTGNGSLPLKSYTKMRAVFTEHTPDNFYDELRLVPQITINSDKTILDNFWSYLGNDPLTTNTLIPVYGARKITQPDGSAYSGLSVWRTETLPSIYDATADAPAEISSFKARFSADLLTLVNSTISTDIEVDKSIAQPSDDLNYTIKSTYDGVGAGSDLTVTATRSNYEAFNPASISFSCSNISGCIPNPTYIISGNDIVFTFSLIMPGQSLPDIHYQTQILSSVTNANVTNVAVISSSDLQVNTDSKCPLNCKDSTFVYVRVPGGFHIEKYVDTPVINTDEDMVFDISYTNMYSTALGVSGPINMIDIIPWNGNALIPATAYGGRLIFKDISQSATGAEEFYFTNQPSATIVQDPADPSNAIPGVVWCGPVLAPFDAGAFGSGGCTFGPESVTGVYIRSNVSIPTNSVSRHLKMTLTSSNNTITSVYSNEVSGQVPEMSLPVISNDVSVTVIGYNLSSVVWNDANGDGVRQVTEALLPNTLVCLNGTGVLGEYGTNVDPLKLDPGADQIFGTADDKELCTVTDINGVYSFPNLHIGEYTVSVVPVPSAAQLLEYPTALPLLYTVPTYDGNGVGTIDISTFTIGQGPSVGTYTVQEPDPSNPTGPYIDVVYPLPGPVLPPATVQDFGFMGYKVSGNVWADLNLDNVHGVLSSCGNTSPLTVECGLGNVTVTLYDSLGGVVSTIQTNTDGSYTFTNIPAGSYSVSAGVAQGLSDIAGQNPEAIAITNADLSGIDIPKKTGSLSGEVWYDANNNGLIDGTESASIVTTVKLTGTDVNGNPVNVTTTSVGGVYSFIGLLASTGSYVITETEPVGYTDGVNVVGSLGGTTTSLPDTFEVQLNAGSDGVNYNFGETYDGVLSGYVYIDKNGDGSFNMIGDVPISGVTVTLNTGATALTDVNGYYEFKNLAYASYTVTETQPAGYIDSTDYAGSLGGTVGADSLSGIVLTSVNKVSTDNDFTERWASVSGNVYVEVDGVSGHGVLSSCSGYALTVDCGLGGETVELLDGSGNVVATTQTNLDGSYTFVNVAPGNYTLKELQPVDYETLSSNTITLTVGLVDVVNQDFTEQGGSISGKVWADINDDGVINGGEVAGIVTTIELLDGSGAVIGSTTSTGGVYSFTDLRAGTYSVREVQPSAYDDGKDSVGSSGGVLVSPDTIGTIALGAGEDGVEYNFGELYKMKISGNVAVDLNGNSTYQSGTDRDLSGVVVTLSNGATTTTDVNGYYEFIHVAPGTYTVTETQPTLYANLTPNTLSVTVVGTDVTGQNFLEIGGTLSGYVYEDGNNDGLKGVTESGIVGVMVTISGSDVSGNAITTVSQFTVAGGAYSFIGLPAGTYTVVETQAAGYLDGKDTSGTPPGTVTNDQIAGISLIAGGAGVNHNFGELFPGGISGHVYVDGNGSNTFNAGDTGLSGVVVTLSNGSTTTTDVNGYYEFTNLPSGTYTVVETQPSIYTNGNTINNGLVTGQSDSLTVVVTNSIVLNQDYTEVPNGSISGTVWYDVDQDGILDGGEAGIPGVTVVISGPSGVFTLTTDVNGNYVSGMLSPGAYTVVETDVVGYASSTPNTINATVVAGTALLNQNFGDILSTISGKVYLDKAVSNSTYDVTDSGIVSVKVELLNSANVVISTVYTDASGNYMFTDIKAGSYTIRETQPTEYVSTENGVSIPVTIVAGVDSVNNNFGEKGGSISGYLYIDLDKDNLRDAGETGLSGQVVSLVTGSGTLTTSTDATGYYIFNDLATGTYEVMKSMVSGYTNEMPVSGTPFIGNVSVQNEISDVLMMFPGVNAVNYNFGHIPLVDISGSVWYDVNRDGVKDAGETTMLSGVTINLKDSTGTVVATVTTDVSGNYTFSQVEVGVYTVEEVQPAGYGSSTPNTITVSALTDVDVVSQNFGETLSTVSGYVYIDLNKNNVNDSEVGLSGQTVTLTNGTTTWTTSTNGSGYYIFNDLLSGSYTLTDPNVSGYTNEVGVVGTPFTGVGVVNGVNSLVVTEGVDGTNYNFGHIPLVDISGSVWYDVNRDGVKDAGETTMLVGVTINLKDSTGTVVATVTTDGSGNYTFSQVEVGVYTVEEVQPAGYGSSTPNTITVSALIDVDVTGQNFGEILSTISGRVYADDDMNGSYTGTDRPLVTVVTLSGPVNASVTTNVDGTYQFTDLLSGEYTITETQVAGFNDGVDTVGSLGGSLVSPDSIVVTVGTGVDGVDYNFGEMPKEFIKGVVWFDVNNDGVMDGTETTMLEGVTITLKDSTGAVVATTVTDANGEYNFGEIEIGEYEIVESQPSGYGSSTPNSVMVTVVDNEVVVVNFGETKKGSIQGTVYVDDTGNGVQDTTDGVIEGVVVKLTGVDGQGNAVTIETTTDANGNYIFVVEAGVYNIEEVQPSNYNDGGDNLGSLGGTATNDKVTGIVVNGQEDGVDYDFGELGGKVSGLVYNDANNNQVQDAGEEVMPGVVVKIKDELGNVVDQVVTGVDGSYEILGVSFGKYVVTEEVPSGYRVTTTNPLEIELTSTRTEVLGVSFGNLQKSEIVVNVYNDVNSSKVKEVGEGNMSGFVVILRDVSGVEVGRGTSDADGNVRFTDLYVGNYSVEIESKTGWMLTTDQKVSVVLGVNVETVSFGVVKELAKTGAWNPIFQLLELTR